MCFRRLLCNRQPAAGNTLTPVGTSWRINAKIGWWLWFHQDWPGRCLQPGQVMSEKSWKALAEHSSRSSTSERIPFGISSGPVFLQQVMDEITSDLPGVAVYLDDILCSGTTAEAHLQNLRRLLERLRDKGLRCRLEKCSFAQPQVYLGTCCPAKEFTEVQRSTPSTRCQDPMDVSTLRSFLGPVQFYAKFLPPTFDSVAETAIPPYQERSSVGMGFRRGSSFASDVGALIYSRCARSFWSIPSIRSRLRCISGRNWRYLFHRYSDGSERPIANIPKTLTASQRNYSVGHHLRLEEIIPIFIWKKVYFNDGPPAFSGHVPTE